MSAPILVFVSSHAQPGGSEKVLEDLVAGLPAGSVAEVVVLQDGPLVQRIRARGVPVCVLPTGGSRLAVLGAARRLSRRLKDLAPDLIHANGVKAAIVAVLATKRIPVVWMKHDVSFDGRVGRFVARRCAAIVGVSHEVLRGIGDPAGGCVVHPGVTVDAPSARSAGSELRRSLQLSGPVVSVIGRMEPSKGHGEILEGFPLIAAEASELELLLVGGDDANHPGWRGVLQARAQAMGVSERVHILGHTPASAVLAASDAVVVPTVPQSDGRGREGFGLIAAEALALGTPVVAYRVGATEEVIGECGLLVNPGDRTALAAAVVRVLRDEELRGRLKCCGEDRARIFSTGRMVDEMMAVYRRLCA